MAACCAGGSCCQGAAIVAATMAVAARIVVVGILCEGPNSIAFVVDAANPLVGYTPCGTLEEYR
jgi:hypothetical protein